MSVDRMARNCCACNVRVTELTGLRVITFVPHQVTVATDAPFTSGQQASANDPKALLLTALAGALAWTMPSSDLFTGWQSVLRRPLSIQANYIE